MWIAETWAEIDKWIFATCTPTVWDVRGAGDLRQDTSYLVVSNHQSWVDIPALIQVFNRRTPYFKFFLKKELIWVPFLGLAWWALEYPFMKRYSKAFLEKHPELKGKDLEITRAACEKFKRIPVTVVNYLEGTRFSEQKKAQQQSPYRHLLKPKAGGWPSSSPRWASSWTPCSTSPWSTRATRFRDSGTCSADGCRR